MRTLRRVAHARYAWRPRMSNPMTAAELDQAYLCCDCEATHTSGQCHKCRRPVCTKCGGDSEICSACASAAEGRADADKDARRYHP